jgi:hypothetical protein
MEVLVFDSDRTIKFLAYACPVLLAMSALSLGQMRRPLLLVYSLLLATAVWIVSERL